MLMYASFGVEVSADYNLELLDIYFLCAGIRKDWNLSIQF